MRCGDTRNERSSGTLAGSLHSTWGRIEPEAVGGWYLQTSRFIIVLLSPSPKREHFKPPILISRHEHFFGSARETSHPHRLFHSDPLCFPIRVFHPFSPRYGVGGFTLSPLYWLLLGHLRISIPMSVCNMYGIFVDNDCFPFCSRSLIGMDTQNDRGNFFAVCW